MYKYHSCQAGFYDTVHIDIFSTTLTLASCALNFPFPFVLNLYIPCDMSKLFK